MNNTLQQLVDASFELGHRLAGTRFKVEKITTSKDALIHIHGDRLRYQEPMAEFGVGKARICDIQIVLDAGQGEDFKFVISIKTRSKSCR